MLRKLNYDKIDWDRYEQCLHQSHNYKPYAEKKYLNAIADRRFYCLVYDDYQAIMPIVYHQKHIIKRVYQPAFCQQLGVFSSQKLSAEELEAFYLLLQKSSISSYAFNDANSSKIAFPSELRANYELELNCNYETLKNNYNQNTKRNLKKLQNEKVSWVMEKHYQANDLKLLLQGNQHYQLNPAARKTFSKLYPKMLHQGYGFTLKLLINNEVQAIAFFIQMRNYLIYSQSVLLSPKKGMGLMHSVIDKVIQEYCDQDICLSFEGSQKESIAQFFKGFGAKNHPFNIVY